MHKTSARVLTFIKAFIKQNRYPPSTREIVAGAELSSTSVADYHLGLLANGGYIHIPQVKLLNRRPARAIIVTEKGERWGTTTD